jgi:NhaA family Na+:H+ antiporter
MANTIFGAISHLAYEVGGESLEYWINDGLMTIFFFIGLELEREIYEGELSNIKDALLPIFAA